jgi:hypothetical protein
VGEVIGEAAREPARADKAELWRQGKRHDSGSEAFCESRSIAPSFRSRRCLGDRREFMMSLFSYRKHLRYLSHSQRRLWWEQRKRLTPRVRISGAYIPPSVAREFMYVKFG